MLYFSCCMNFVLYVYSINVLYACCIFCVVWKCLSLTFSPLFFEFFDLRVLSACSINVLYEPPVLFEHVKKNDALYCRVVFLCYFLCCIFVLYFSCCIFVLYFCVVFPRVGFLCCIFVLYFLCYISAVEFLCCIFVFYFSCYIYVCGIFVLYISCYTFVLYFFVLYFSLCIFRVVFYILSSCHIVFLLYCT